MNVALRLAKQLPAASYWLHEADEKFKSLLDTDFTCLKPALAHCLIRETVYNLFSALHKADEDGFSVKEISDHIPNAKKAFHLSDFARRATTWPRGYRGDFETISYLIEMTNHHSVGELANFIHQYCLNNPMAQQHRNKVSAQSRVLLKGLFRRPNARVLSIACGTCPDFRKFIDLVPNTGQTIVINDIDRGALDCATSEFEGSRFNPIIVEGNVIKSLKSIGQHGPYDAIVAGGLFDYLDRRSGEFIAKTMIRKMLTPGGEFFFTNIACGNPYRMWLECVVDWPLIERTEEDMRDIVSGCEDVSELVVELDESRLAYLASVVRN